MVCRNEKLAEEAKNELINATKNEVNSILFVSFQKKNFQLYSTFLEHKSFYFGFVETPGSNFVRKKLF